MVCFECGTFYKVAWQALPFNFLHHSETMYYSLGDKVKVLGAHMVGILQNRDRVSKEILSEAGSRETHSPGGIRGGLMRG